MTSADIKRIGKTNWRGISTDYLVFEILDLKAKLDMLPICHEEAIGFTCPNDCPETEWVELHQQLYEAQLAECQKELDRRRNIIEIYIKNPDREIIQAIKQNCILADVIEKYTQVFYSSKDQLKFRCTLHGEDKNPSGIIYN
ncbi:MAG: hypothetical protein KKE30_04995, partial [Gammaproteobacteria bacterium]|nr:hypothetical protein [Gammaproteobacteria bacterium]